MVRHRPVAALAMVLTAALLVVLSVTIDPSGRVRAAGFPPQTATPDVSAASVRSTLNKYCVSCHNDRLRTAELSLEKIDTSNIGDAAATWEKVVGKLRSGTMPPPRLPRPDQATAAAV